MAIQWQERYSKQAGRMITSAIREILKFAQQPDIISMAGGCPAPELFPVKELSEIGSYVMAENRVAALQYGLTDGYPPLRDFLAERMTADGVEVSEDNIVITAGSQQALDLIGRVFIDPGDAIIVDKPTYLGAIQSWHPYGPKFVAIPLDDDGTRVDLLEEAIVKNHPKFAYILPNFHNPAGVTLSLERREKLVELADKYGVVIVEDDPYGELRYEGERITPIIALDAQRNGGNVLYLSTFSKLLTPGLRLGWIIGPAEVIRKLVIAKQGADLFTNSLGQAMAYEYCRRGLLPPHIAEIRSTYKERRDTMLAALERYFPEGIRWTHPKGGLFLWVILPEKIDSAELLKEAVGKEKVAFVPGGAFFTDGTGHNTMRLTFATVPPEKLEEGIKRLGRAIKRRLG